MARIRKMVDGSNEKKKKWEVMIMKALNGQVKPLLKPFRPENHITGLMIKTFAKLFMWLFCHIYISILCSQIPE